MAVSMSGRCTAIQAPFAYCLTLSVLLICAAGCNSDVTARQLEVLGSEQAIDLLKNAKGGEAYRVAWSNERIPAGREVIGEFKGYPVLAGPVPIDAKTTADLAAIVLKEALEGSDERPNCIFAPGIGVQVDADGKALSILFCFDCNEFRVTENGKRFEIENIGFSRDALLDLFKLLFPDDKSFQKAKTIDELSGGRRPTSST